MTKELYVDAYMEYTCPVCKEKDALVDGEKYICLPCARKASKIKGYVLIKIRDKKDREMNSVKAEIPIMKDTLFPQEFFDALQYLSIPHDVMIAYTEKFIPPEIYAQPS